MKNNLIFLTLFFLSFEVFSQVGINTMTPQAQLEIKSSNQAAPSNTDGILIPKIDAFPLTNPTALQQGMMVYLTTLSAGKQPGFYYWDNTGTPQWKGFGGSPASVGWETTGNIGTNPAVNFVGTTDDNDFVFKRNNIKSGVISIYNTAFGNTAFSSNTLGNVNAAFGAFALQANDTGNNNTGIGVGALRSNVSGNYNTTLGSDTMISNSTGISNVAIGSNALESNVSGGSNTAVGADALLGNNGSGNVALGNQSGLSNQSGNNNITIGTGSDVPNSVGNDQLSIANVIYGANMSTTASGKIGIGVPVPTEKLEVAGKTKTTNFQMTTGAALSNILTSDAVGNATWQTPNAALNSFAWTTTGNAGTNPATNFVGTTDDIDLVFRRNSVRAGYLGNINTSFGNYALNSLSSGNVNTAFGSYALQANDTGSGNSANGHFALNMNTTGSRNIANGQASLRYNTAGDDNIGIGYSSLFANETGNKNIAIGTNAMGSNKSGSNATAIGYGAMQYQNDTTTPFDNHSIAVGYEALRGSTTPANNTGIYNTAIGYQTLLDNSTGNYNSAVGERALYKNTTGYLNNAFGYLSLAGNTTGIANNAFGSEIMVGNQTGSYNSGFGHRALNASNGDGNSAFGYNALYSNQTGNFNVGIGRDALYNNRVGSNGTAIGYRAMFNANGTATPFTNSNVAVGYEALLGSATLGNNTGNSNTAIGYQTLLGNSSGNNNTAIGYQAGNANTTGNNNITIGAGSIVFNPAGNNQMSIANVFYGGAMDNIINARFSIGDVPSVLYKFYTYSPQATANGDGQSSIYGLRTRDFQNDGIDYSLSGTNKGVSGYNYWGDVYTFGVTGHSDNDYTRTGGVLGAIRTGAYWASLGYKNSGSTPYGIYATTALGTGTGKLSQSSSQSSIGGGFYGGIIGSWSKGNIGNISSGNLFASYNSGDEYTSGKQIEIVSTATGKKAAYTVTSTESVIYKKGKITLVNGTARIDFDSDYAALLGDAPIVTTTPMGQCNGIYIESVDKSGFTVKELNNGTSNVQISWIAVGDRIDASKTIQRDVLADDFDNNINEVMFNENNKQDNAKAMWSDGNKINFGKLPENLIEKPVKTEDKK